MPPGGADVILQRLTLKGPASEARLARQNLLRALDDAPWPIVPGEAVIHLRRVSVQGTTLGLAGTLDRELRRILAQAVDGWSPEAENAEAVRFRSPADQAACFVRDLLEGRSARRWFWESGAPRTGPISANLARALLETPLAFPTILDRLAETGWEARFWFALEPPDAARVLASLGQATGWLTALAEAMECSGEPSTPVLSVPLRPSLLPPGCAPRDPRTLLAALGFLWRAWPGAFRGTGAAARLAAVASGLATLPDPVTPQAQPAAKEAPALEFPGIPGEAVGETKAEVSTPAPEAPPRIAAPDGPRSSDSAAPPLGDFPEVRAPGEAPTEASQAGEWHGFTTQGGFFFLVNALAWEGYQQRLQGWEEPGGGWRLVLGLALALGCDPDDGLRGFLGRESGLMPEELEAVVPLDASLAHLGAQRYGEALWRGELLALPARIVATPSHLDIHFRLADARLEVRRVGLDVNPGWVPWLGRVITFHFGSGLEPEHP